MTRLICRLVLAMLLLPTAGAVFLLLMAPVMVQPPGTSRLWWMLLAWLGVYTYITAYWTLLWNGFVRWTRLRLWAAAAAWPVGLALGAAFGLGFQRLTAGAPLEAAVLVGGGVPPIVWTLATVLLWRETPRERAARLAALGGGSVLCPLCGYNLTGLHEARCPECGASFTLERLFAAQPGRDERTLQDVG
ncbi:MAG: hypothetical protein D6824_08860 [Planctomycetota bacterium]|nr:MAG: hypothetical protein D6824_08860 [Planctomycetota bacterium]